MTLIVPTAGVPNQSFNVVLDSQAVTLAIYTQPVPPQYYLLGQPNTYQETGTMLVVFMDVTYQSSPVKTCTQCVNLGRILSNTQYGPLVGDFIWVDTQGSLDPQWPGLGTRWQLVYLEAGDVG